MFQISEIMNLLKRLTKMCFFEFSNVGMSLIFHQISLISSRYIRKLTLLKVCLLLGPD